MTSLGWADIALRGVPVTGDTMSVTIGPRWDQPRLWWARLLPRLYDWMISRTVSVVVGYGWTPEMAAEAMRDAINNPTRRFLWFEVRKLAWPYVAEVRGATVRITHLGDDDIPFLP